MTRKFTRLKVDFFVPEEVEKAISALEVAYLEDSPVWDCYLDELWATIHTWQDVPNGFSEEDGEKLLHYYYGRHFLD